MTEEELLGAMLSMDDNEITRESIVKAAFKYPGSKDNSIEHILPHLPYTDEYCEPFGGSGVILLARRQVKNEYFNDRYSGVTDFYRVVKDPTLLPRLLDWLDFTLHSREEFNRCRDTWQDVNDPVERAARWYISIQMSFQAYGRHYGRSLSPNNRFSTVLPNSLEKFWPVHHRLKGVYIENQDWRHLFKDLNSLMRVWYLDPTYLGDDVSNGGMYSHIMSRTDHIEMLERIHNQLIGYVALSGYQNELYDSYPWDAKYTWEVRETSSAKIGTESNGRIGTEGTNSGVRIECLWIKNFRG